jgi:DNA-binding transcriptional regulator YiaG
MEDSMKSKVKELREKYQLTQAKLSELYGIPKRSIENWEAGSRKPPEYVVNLLEKALEADFTEENE